MSPVFYPPAASGGGGAAFIGSTPAVKAKAGNWFGPYEVPGTGSYAGTLNRLDLTPFYVPQSTNLDTIACLVATGGAAGAVVRLGIFNSKADGMPGTVKLDAGTVVATSTGVKSIGITHTLAAGLYYLGAAPQVAVSTMRAFGAETISRFGYDYDQGYFESLNANAISYLTVAGVTGAFADLTSASFGYIASDAIKVAVKASA